MFLLLKSGDKPPRKNLGDNEMTLQFNMKSQSLLGAACASLIIFSMPLTTMAAQSLPLPFTVKITEVQRMNWGTIAIPPSGTQYLDLSPINQSVTGTGTVLFGSPQRGIYKLSGSGDGSASITIDIANVSSGSSSLKLDHFQGVYSSIYIKGFPSPTLPAPTRMSNATMLYVGARATIASAMTTNSLLPTFDIDIIVN